MRTEKPVGLLDIVRVDFHCEFGRIENRHENTHMGCL